MHPPDRALTAGLRAQEVRNAATFFEAAIARYLEEIGRDYEAKVRHKFAEDAIDEFIDHGIERWRVEGLFARTLRFSLFVTMYSFLEADLHQLCLDYHQAEHLALGPGDISGKGINRSRLYLKKVVGLDFPDQHSTWHSIQSYVLIRNCIVHSGGRVGEDGNAKRLRSLLPTDQFAWSGADTIVVEPELLLKAVGTVSDFWDELWRRARRRAREQGQ